MDRFKTTSERIDNLPLLIYWLKGMQVDRIIDRVLGPAHGNWEGLSYGEVALVVGAYVVMRCTHFLSPMQGWAGTHRVSLSQALGKAVREQDFSDDRLGLLLGRLGEEATQPGEAIEEELGRPVLRAYDLPTDTARIDMTTVAVHHQSTDESGLMHFGHSKDHRPDLRQFKAVLGTLDPVGIPLMTATVSGDQADDPLYVPAWERLVATVERADFLTVGDCKLASLATRAHLERHGGFYLAPLPLTGHTPAQLQAWGSHPPVTPQAIRLPGQAPSDAPLGQGFEVEAECSWHPPDRPTPLVWSERRLIVQSEAHAQRQRTGLQQRLRQAETALRALKPAAELAELESRAQAVLNRYGVIDYLELRYLEQLESQTRYLGPGRPGPHRVQHTIETKTWTVKTKRRRAALNHFNRLAGWRV